MMESVEGEFTNDIEVSLLPESTDVNRTVANVVSIENIEWAAPLEYARETIYKVAWYLPEVAFWLIGIYELIIPELLEKASLAALPQMKAMDISWNLIDAISCIVIGVTLGLDRHTHQRTAWDSRLLAVFYIVVGAQLAFLTSKDNDLLLSPSFALVALNDFIISCGVLLHAHRLSKDDDHWLKDALAQLVHTQKNIAEFEAEIARFPSSDWAAYKEQRLQQAKEAFSKNEPLFIACLADRIELLPMEDLESQTALAPINDARSDSSLSLESYEALSDSSPPVGNYEAMQSLFSAIPINRTSLEKVYEAFKNAVPEQRMALAKQRSDENDLQLTKHQWRAGVFFIAVTGWLMMCFKKLYEFSVLVVSVAALYYLFKHLSWLCEKSKPCCSQFFSLQSVRISHDSDSQTALLTTESATTSSPPLENPTL